MPVLIAVVDPDHLHHDAARRWLTSHNASFATCPITQGALVRYLFRQGHSSVEIGDALERIDSITRHQFWADDVPFTAHTLVGLIGHRQVTDSYLCSLALHRGGLLATYDRCVAATRPAATTLLPTA